MERALWIAYVSRQHHLKTRRLLRTTNHLASRSHFAFRNRLRDLRPILNGEFRRRNCPWLTRRRSDGLGRTRVGPFRIGTDDAGPETLARVSMPAAWPSCVALLVVNVFAKLVEPLRGRYRLRRSNDQAEADHSTRPRGLEVPARHRLSVRLQRAVCRERNRSMHLCDGVFLRRPDLWCRQTN